MIIKNETLKDIVATRAEYKQFLEYLNEKYSMDDSEEASISKGWIEALNFVLKLIGYDKKDNEVITENQVKIQEMIHCEDGHCDT